jgi:hypothetical protein
MNVADYVAGFAALSLILLPWAFSATRLHRWLLPEWTGAAGVLVAAIFWVSGILVLAELLGGFGAFSRWSMAGASAGTAVAALALVPRRASPNPPLSAGKTWVSARSRTDWVALVLAALCLVGVSAAMLGRDARVLHTGPTDVDSLDYHLTNSADFVRTGSIDHLHQTAASDANVYYPFDDELLDAVGMLGPHPDVATLGLNIGFAWLALLACWVIGARWAMGTVAVAAGTAVLALPLLAAAASGPGLNDVPSMAALLAAIAVLVHSDRPPEVGADRSPQRWLRSAAVAGLALGLAGGSKLSLLAPVLIVALAVVVTAPVRKAATAVIVAGAALLTGGFWYARDWIAVGSPVPSVNLTIAGHGFHGVPYPEVKPRAFTVAHYLTNTSVIRHWFVPALKVDATPLWPLVLALAAVGIVVGLFSRGTPVRRLLSIAALFGLAVYVVTPTTAEGPPGEPILFGANFRYVIPAMAIAILLVATAPALRRVAMPMTAGFTALTLALLASSTAGAVVDRPIGFAAAAVVAASVAWTAVAVRGGPSRLVTAGLLVAGLLAVAVVGAVVQRGYLRHRYAGSDPRDRLLAWANPLQHARIGVVGFPSEYSFFGTHLNNDVSYVGVYAADHSFAAPTSCLAWRAALTRGRYQYVVVQPGTPENTVALLRWTTSVPGVSGVLRNPRGTVLKLPATIGTAGCSPRVG